MIVRKQKFCACGYTFFPPSARQLIDLAQGDRPQRDVDGADVIRHVAEEYACSLEMLGITE